MVTETAAGKPLTDLERRLVDYVTRGELLDLADDEPVDEAAMRTWGDSRTIKATVLRDILRGRLAPEPDPHGLRLRGARVDGRLDLENLTTTVALELCDCLLDEGMVATYATLPFLTLSGCRLEHPAEQPPLDADRLTAAALYLDKAAIISNCELGAVRLRGAHLGKLDCSGARIRNDAGPALDGEGLQADQSVLLRDRFKAVGAGKSGAVRLLGAHVVGELGCRGARICNATGPALIGDGLQVDQAVFLSGAFTAVGTGELGAVRLLGAHVGGQLECRGTRIRNATGPALVADSLQVDRSIFLRDGFKAVGDSELGAVRLPSAHVGGELDCTKATMRSHAGPALVANGLQVDQKITLDQFKAVGAGNHETVNLRNARINGVLMFAPVQLENTTTRQALLALDGLTYTGLPLDRVEPAGKEISDWQGISVDLWLELLREATPSYAAQPYQQFAAAHRAAGHDSEVRRILMAQRRDQIHRGGLSKPEKAWGRLTGLTLGYGYKPWRALIGLVVVAAIAVVLAFFLGADGGVARVKPDPPTATQCSGVERVGVGLDLGLPLIKTGIRAHCDTTTSTTGQVLTVVGWVLQLLAWGFATLFIAGFTGIVRKT